MDLRRGQIVDISPNVVKKLNIEISRLGPDGWTVTRQPVRQADGRLVVPVHKADQNGVVRYVDDVPAEYVRAREELMDIEMEDGGKRRGRSLRTHSTRRSKNGRRLTRKSKNRRSRRH